MLARATDPPCRTPTPEWLQGVVQAIPEALVVADVQGRIQLWNRAAETLFGYAEQEVLGADLNLIVPERFRPAHDAGFARPRRPKDRSRRRLRAARQRRLAREAWGCARHHPRRASLVRGVSREARPRELRLRRATPHAQAAGAVADFVAQTTGPTERPSDELNNCKCHLHLSGPTSGTCGASPPTSRAEQL